VSQAAAAGLASPLASTHTHQSALLALHTPWCEPAIGASISGQTSTRRLTGRSAAASGGHSPPHPSHTFTTLPRELIITNLRLEITTHCSAHISGGVSNKHWARTRSYSTIQPLDGLTCTVFCHVASITAQLLIEKCASNAVTRHKQALCSHQRCNVEVGEGSVR